MGMKKIIKKNMEELRKEVELLINFKDKIIFFILNGKYVLEDLEDMKITQNQLYLKLKGVEKKFIIDRKFFLTLKQLKILIMEEKDIFGMFENEEVTKGMLSVREDFDNKKLPIEEKMSARKITSIIEDELLKKMDLSKLDFKYRYREYTFDN